MRDLIADSDLAYYAVLALAGVGLLSAAGLGALFLPFWRWQREQEKKIRSAGSVA